MALCPFAKHLLIPPGANDPRIKARAAILHVDAGNADSLFAFFRDRSGGIESHFFVKRNGLIEQYRDTAFQADANRDANDFAISIETQGFGQGEWTSAQLTSIKRLLVWCARVHGFPLRKIPRWDGSGVGYHTLFGAPSRWTPVAKTCPGPDRVRQFERVLVPWMDAQGDPEPELLDLVVGDWNLSVGALRELADAAGATFVKGNGVDHALVRGLKATKVRVLAKGGSDHKPVLFDFDAHGHPLRVLEWNVYVGQSPLRVRVRLSRLVAKFQPDIIVLSEAARCGKHLAGLAKHRRYQLFQGVNVGEGADCALLVRNHLDIGGAGVARMREKWIGPKHGRRHEPRVYPKVRIRLAPGLVLRVMAVHLPFGPAAVGESKRRISSWIKNGAKS